MWRGSFQPAHVQSHGRGLGGVCAPSFVLGLVALEWSKRQSCEEKLRFSSPLCVGVSRTRWMMTALHGGIAWNVGGE
jgi:hypothetical protein